MNSVDVLTLTRRAEIAIESGEGHFTEFKSALEGKPGEKKPRYLKDLCEDIAVTLVAFANADGGQLLVGVEDDGDITGIDGYSEEKINALLDAPVTYVLQDTPLPVTRATKLALRGTHILFFAVSKGTHIHQTSSGRCVIRKDKHSVPGTFEFISISRAEIRSREYDREFIDGANVTHLDDSLVRVVADHISRGMSIDKCLQYLDLAVFDGEHLRLRRAALLLFGKHVEQWHPRCQVRVLKVEGTEIQTGKQYNVIYDAPAVGNILTLIESSWDLLRPHLTETRFSKDATFRTEIRYPELACREALTNAIAHRDYSVEGRGIEIHVYTDRLEIINPGGLVSTIKREDIEQLRGVHDSRNTYVAKVLKEAGYMRELGEGVRRIYEEMKLNDLERPQIISENNEFHMILHYRSVYSREEKLWLENFEHLNLTREQKSVIRLGYNGRKITPNQIYEATGIVDVHEYNRFITQLRDMGIFQRTMRREKVLERARATKINQRDYPQFVVIMPQKAHRPDEISIYVGKIPYGLDQHIMREELHKIFSRFGRIERIHIPTDSSTGLGRGFAFVIFDNETSVTTVLNNTSPLYFENRRLEVKKPQRRE